LQTALKLKGFDAKWCRWIQDFITRGSVGIKVNDYKYHLQTRKGLQQGDPLSPILFNIIAIIINGLIAHLVDRGVSILQYADDTIIYLDHDLEKALNMKLILCFLEQLLGLKINFHKSEVFYFGKAKGVEDQYRTLFGCESSTLPFKYLGIPIHFRRLKNGEWKPIEDKFEIKLSSWIGKLLSYGDRLILINLVLTSLPMFLLSFFEIPKGVRKRLDCFRSPFFWQNDGHKKKYRLTKWNIICRPKDQGGLGIEALEIKNRCLLTKWFFKLLNEEEVWQEILKNKYLHSKSLAEVTIKPNDSPFWKGLMKMKEDFLSRGSFKVGNGLDTRFWEDTCPSSSISFSI
jgi:hypothetical protein